MSCEGVGNLSRNLLSLSVARCLAENCEAVEGRGLQTAPQPVRVHKHIIIHLEDILDPAASGSDPLEEEGCLESEIEIGVVKILNDHVMVIISLEKQCLVMD